MIVLACTFRTDEGVCLLNNKPCDGCMDAPAFIDFEDDVEEKTERYEEWCADCDHIVDIANDFRVQKCPNCGKWLVPCSICPLENCSKVSAGRVNAVSADTGMKQVHCWFGQMISPLA